MKNTKAKKDLRSRLPHVRGTYRENVNLDKLTWFRVGGPADILFRPKDCQDLRHFLKSCPKDIPIFPMGVGSNLIVRDGGIRGVVIRLGSGFQNIYEAGGFLDVGSGLLDRTLSNIACEEGWGGLEFLCGIPGTIGGALRMNAGCYDQEIGDILDRAFVIDRSGKQHELTVQDLKMGYRRCDLDSSSVFIGARLRIKKTAPEKIRKTVKQFLEKREATQPVRERTGGSTFANPLGTVKAWELIDQVGLRGATLGDAMVSPMHCNFLINKGAASAKDLEDLGENIRRKVMDQARIDLRWEIKCIGEKHREFLKNVA